MVFRLDELRIRRLDRNNIVIERLRGEEGKKYWQIWKYFGKPEDLVRELITLTVEIEEGKDLREQIVLLSDNINKTRDSIISHLKSCE